VLWSCVVLCYVWRDDLRFVVLTGWDGTESHLFYYRSESDTQASGILFLR